MLPSAISRSLTALSMVVVTEFTTSNIEEIQDVENMDGETYGIGEDARREESEGVRSTEIEFWEEEKDVT